MIYDYCPEYVDEGFVKGFEEKKPYYISYINKNQELQTIKVFIESIYSERIPGPTVSGRDRREWYAKLFLPKKRENFFKNIVCCCKPKYVLYDKYIEIAFIKETVLDAQIAFLNITSHPKNNTNKNIRIVNSSFAHKYPDIYIKRVMSYKGMTMTKQPLSTVDYL